MADFKILLPLTFNIAVAILVADSQLFLYQSNGDSFTAALIMITSILKHSQAH